jgi:hypothetical protein
MMDAKTTEVQIPNTNDAQTTVKAAPAEKHAPRRLDKFAERRAAVKKQKRKAHRHSIASSNTNG